MIVLKWLLLYFCVLLKVPAIRSSLFTSCLPYKSCQISLKIAMLDDKKDNYNPLYLTGKSGSYELAKPRGIEDEKKSNNVMVFFSNKKKLIYACPRSVKQKIRDKVTAELLQQEDISLSSESLIVDKCCPQKVEPTVINLNKVCSKTGLTKNAAMEFNLYEVGFRVFVRHRSIVDFILFRPETRMKSTWHPLYTVCHNTTTRTTLFSIHTIDGESVSVASIDFRGNFRDVDTIELLDETKDPNKIDTTSISMNTMYKKDVVQKLFRTLFKTREKNYVDDGQNFFAKGHLVPDADMTFTTWKNATYLYMNAVPMWQYINNGIWKTIENQIRKLTKLSKQTFKIYTGVHDILSYKNIDIYLGGEKTLVTPVPLYLWKIVHNENTSEAIAFVVNNDPYTERGDYLCSHIQNDEDICSANGWSSSVHELDENNKLKIMYCCTVLDLRNNVPNVPNLKLKGILKNLNK